MSTGVGDGWSVGEGGAVAQSPLVSLPQHDNGRVSITTYKMTHVVADVGFYTATGNSSRLVQ